MTTLLEKYLARKPFDSYPDYVKKEMKIISFFKKELPVSYGSYLYRFQRAPGDIDLLQHVNYKDENTAVRTFIRVLHNIIKSFDNKHIFSEFKAGFDTKYFIDIGGMMNGIYTPHKDLNEILYAKYKEGLFTKDEFFSMHLCLIQIHDDKDNTKLNEWAYDYIYNLIRNKRVLRWSAQEIMKGYKIISMNRKYTLADAIKDDTMVKIDLIVFLNGKFMEITNLLFITYTDTDAYGNEIEVPVNVSEDVLHNLANLKLEVEKLYYSDKFYSPMKACKRIYAIMRATREYEYLEKQVVPILNSSASLIYQIKSELEAIIIVLENKFSKINVDRIFNQLQDIKGRLNYNLDISEDVIINLSHEFDHICKLRSKESLIEGIEHLSKQIKQIINYQTIMQMDTLNFNPFPLKFMPGIFSYNNAIIRKPTDNPSARYNEFVNVIKEASDDVSRLKM